MGATNSSDKLGFDALFDPFPPLPSAGNQRNVYPNTGAYPETGVSAPYHGDTRYCSNAIARHRCNTVSTSNAIDTAESRVAVPIASQHSQQWQQEKAKRKAVALNKYSFTSTTNGAAAAAGATATAKPL